MRKLNVALAQFRLQDIQQAVSYLQFMDLNLLTEGQRAVFAGIASRAGFIDEAAGVVKAISPQATMLPEESRFLQRVLSAK
jgi:hypothetical protein